MRKHPARHQHGTGEFLPAALPDARKFRVPEFAVEASVVRNQRMVADKICRGAHHLRRGWRLAHHGIADAGEIFDERRNAHARIHQALIAIDDHPVRTRTAAISVARGAMLWRQSRRLEVDDCDRLYHDPRSLIVLEPVSLLALLKIDRIPEPSPDFNYFLETNGVRHGVLMPVNPIAVANQEIPGTDSQFGRQNIVFAAVGRENRIVWLAAVASVSMSFSSECRSIARSGLPTAPDGSARSRRQPPRLAKNRPENAGARHAALLLARDEAPNRLARPDDSGFIHGPVGAVQ